MKLKFRHLFFSALSLLLLGASLSAPTYAKDYPDRPVTLMVPFPPSGPTDIMGRLLADKLSKLWGVPVITENHPGAGGNIGTRRCREAAPDGYTMCIMSIGQTIAPSFYAKPGFDPVKDFAHVSMLVTMPYVLLVHPKLGVKNVSELIALAKAKPGALSYASGGTGTSTNLLTELFKHDAGVNIVHIPYKGQGPALIDQISGRIAVAFDTVITAMPYVKEGKLLPIAVSTKERFPMLPNVPTIDQSGLKGFEGGSWWAGIVMPAGTPSNIVNKVNADMAKVLKSPEMKEKMLSMGAVATSDTSEEFTAFVAAETAKWAKVVKDAGIHGD